MPPAKKKAKTESMPAGVRWMYKDDKKWKEYGLEDQQMLEKSYGSMRGGKKVMETKKLTFNKEYGSVYVFDFKNWTQHNKDSDTTRKIMRCVEDSDEESEDEDEEGDDVQWEVQDNHQMWTAFYDEDNELIETAYQKNKKKIFKTAELTFNKGFDSTYSFDWKNMKQTNEDSGNSRNIRRKANGKPKAWKIKNYGISGSTGSAPAEAVKGVLSYPDTWSKQKDPMMDQFEVKSGSTEYNDVLKDFFKTIHKKVTVKKLMRVQNYALWPFYALNKDKISKTNGKFGCNEKMLFHGARVRANMDCILKYGFDTRVANAGLCGTGTYFAVNANYSDSGYVFKAQDGTKEMMICRVLVGRHALRKGNDRRPPPLDPKKPNSGLYDSVVDNMQNPVMHVVFYDNQAVPEYVVYYK